MKQVLSERNKHRLIGMLVVVSVMIVVMPAIMKQSSQRFEENLTVSLKLPPKPMLPKVAIPNSKTMFKTVKVAKVVVPAAPTVPPSSLIAKAEPLDSKARAIQKSIIASVAHEFKPTAAIKPQQAQQRDVKVAVAAKKETPVMLKPVFSVQVATFVQQENANHLVNQFRRQGFEASFHKIHNEKGDFYRVVVGQLREREKALDLQKKIASNMQLNGFVVKVS